MKDSKKAKWILGTSGVVLSAFLFTQIGNIETENDSTQQDLVLTEKVSGKEKELVQLDWTNFDIETVQEVTMKSNRTSRRS